jgi:hypothetical protein
MLILQCTRKLHEELKTGLKDIPSSGCDSFFMWHIHLFFLNHRKCVLAMNNKTRYTIVLYGLRKEHFSNFSSLLVDAIRDSFLAEKFSEGVIQRYIDKTGDVIFAKTHDRSVLGQINDMIWMTECIISDYLPIKAVNIIELNKQNNRTPMVKMKYGHAIDALKEALAGF